MPIPVNSTLNISFEYYHHGQRLLNTTHWKVIAGGVLSEALEMQALANYVGDAGVPTSFASKILNIIPDTCTLYRVRVQNVAPIRGSYKTKLVNTVGARGSSDTANIDAVITKRTDAAGRSQVGNFFLPGIDPNDMALGLIEPAFITAIETNLAWLKQRLEVAGGGPTLDPVIFHRNAGQSDLITSLVVQEEVRVMVRRTVRRGE